MNSLLDLLLDGSLVLIIVAASALITALILVFWIASGSPDVNGEKERDAGTDEGGSARAASGETSAPRLVPQCSWCRRIKSRHGWCDIKLLVTPSHVTFTHGICPECQVKHFPVVSLGGGNSERLQGASPDRALRPTAPRVAASAAEAAL